MTTPRFKKGQKVTRVTNWDQNGMFVYEQCEVISCGKKQMALLSLETGQNLGNHFRPDGSDGTYEVMTNEEALAECVRQAEGFIADAAAHLRRLEATGYAKEDPDYFRHMQEKFESMSAPCGDSKVDRMDAIRAGAGLPATRK